MQRVSVFKYTYCLMQMQMCYISEGDTDAFAFHLTSFSDCWTFSYQD